MKKYRNVPKKSQDIFLDFFGRAANRYGYRRFPDNDRLDGNFPIAIMSDNDYRKISDNNNDNFYKLR